jgi:hypothetical protein
MESGTKMKRKTEITVETERVVVIRRGRSSVQGWCQECARPVKMLTAEAAASVAGVSRRTIYRWAEAEKVHFTEMPNGVLFICLNSLDERRQGDKR